MNDATHTEQDVLVAREGAITCITLNRPRAINALTREMAVEVGEALRLAEENGSTAVLLDGAGERGFCGGGDVKAMSAGGLPGALAFLAAEYRTDHAINAFSLPVVGVMDGITMGGGIGLTGHASVRVVTERSRLAMPETRIGIVPDVGGSLLLARSPGRLGEMLAAASGSLDAGDAIALGFADFFVPSDRVEQLRARLVAGEDPATAAAEIAQQAPESPLLAASLWFDPIADEALGTAEDTLADPTAATLRLVRALEEASGENADAARAYAAQLRAVSPTAAVVAIAQLARVRAQALDLAGVLADDYRVLGRLISRGDFAEGVRAQLIDKDGAPNWAPARLEDVEAAEVARILDPEAHEGEVALQL